MYKARLKYCFFYLLLLLGISYTPKASAQLAVEVPDTAFFNYLKLKYPNVLKSNFLIPSLTSSVTYLGVSGSNITDLEGIQYFKEVQTLSFYSSKIKKIPAIDSLWKLQKMIVYSNDLEALPPLNKLASLRKLICYGNKIKVFPDVAGLAFLDTLMIGGNLFESLPSLENMPNLMYLGAWSCRLKETPKLKGCKKLLYLGLGSNTYLDSLPDLSEFPDLTTIDFDHNRFQTMPDLSKTNIKSAYFQNNQLTFEDILPSTKNPNFVNFGYYPQDSIGAAQEFKIPENEPFTFDINIDKSLTSNTYKWFRNGVLVQSTQKGVFEIEAVSLGDAGIYHVQIQNSEPLLNKLTLVSRKMKLIVLPKSNHVVLSPDGDGNNDELYISHVGKTKIYDKNGLLVYEFNSPGFWTGTTTNGELATTGYYILKNPDETIKISLVR